MKKRTKAKDLHKKWAKDPAYQKAYDALSEEFEIARELITARTAADMTQAEVAAIMETSQSFVARLEGGTVKPTIKSLERYAAATGTRLKIELERVPG
ncbi:MAG: ribosome-binding protein aMBF1 (putative translation factor) [Verrucomicrobiales bacterium]|jgi:ribosome-binding protein aMBF1 (putative translation factor)